MRPYAPNWAADMWEELRRQGLSAEQATHEVQSRMALEESPQQAAPPEPGATAAPSPYAQPYDPAIQATASPAGDGLPDVARAVGQGATLGWGDEMEAGVRALGPQTYGEALKTVRDKQKGFRERHPYANALAELAGSAAPALLTAGMSGLATAGGMIRAGIGYGAVAGAGGSEGSLQDRAGAAGLGAVTGGVLGGAVPVGARLIKGAADVFGTRSAAGIGKRADELLLRGLERDNTSPGKILAALQARRGGSVPSTPAANAGKISTLQGFIGRQEKEHARLLEAFRTGMEGSDAVDTPAAQQRVQELASVITKAKGLLAKEQGVASAIEEVTSAPRQLPKPETLADLAGENVRGVARQAQATPSKAKEGLWTAFEDRAANQPERIASDLETGFGLPRQDSNALIENLIEKRSQNAGPLYQKAFAHGTVNDPRITEMLDLPWFKEAWARGRRLALAEGRQLPETATPDVQSLDYVKRGLDDYLQSGVGKEGGLGPAERRAVRNLKNEMLQRLDAAVPDYAAARAKYAGDSALRDAVESGRDVLKTDPREIGRQLRDMSPGERDMYRVGALDAIRSKMDATGDSRDLTKVIFGNDKVRAQLERVFPNQAAFRRFTDSMNREAEMATTRNVVGHGSPTARIEAEMADAGGMAPQALAQAATGNIGGAITSGIVGGISRRARGVTGAVADALNTSLQAGTKNPGDLEQLLQRLGGAQTQQASKAVAKSAATKAIGAKTGLSTGREFSAEMAQAADAVPPGQEKQPDETPEAYAMRLRRSGVPEQVARAYFAAQGL